MLHLFFSLHRQQVIRASFYWYNTHKRFSQYNTLYLDDQRHTVPCDTKLWSGSEVDNTGCGGFTRFPRVAPLIETTTGPGIAEFGKCAVRSPGLSGLGCSAMSPDHLQTRRRGPFLYRTKVISHTCYASSLMETKAGSNEIRGLPRAPKEPRVSPRP